MGPGQCLHHGLLDVLHSAGDAVDIQKSEPFEEPSEGVPDTLELVWGNLLFAKHIEKIPDITLGPWDGREPLGLEVFRRVQKRVSPRSQAIRGPGLVRRHEGDLVRKWCQEGDESVGPR